MDGAGTSEELTRDQRDELTRDLRALRDEVRGALAAARTGGEPVDPGLPIGRISRMDAIQQQQMAQAGVAALAVVHPVSGIRGVGTMILRRGSCSPP